MAFNISSQTTKQLESVGSYSGFFVGVGTSAASGLLSITVPGMKVIEGVTANAMKSSAGYFVHVKATSANTATLQVRNKSGTATSSVQVCYQGWGKGIG